MRRRLVLSTLGVALVAVVLLGVPLAFAGVLLVRDNAQRTAQGIAESVGRAVDRLAAAGDPVPGDVTAELDRVDSRFAVHLQLAGGAVQARGDLPGSGSTAGHYESPAVTVTVAEEPQRLRDEQLRTVLLVVTVAAVAMAAAAGVGLLQARRLTAPLVELARTARRLGSGEAVTPAPPRDRPRIDEVDRVAEVLQQSSERITKMLAAERQFAADASHQLRTPLTALSMRLEEIQHTDDPEVVREEAGAALVQVERLSAVIDDLLSAARQPGSTGAGPLPVDDVVGQQVQEWQPAFTAAQRRIKLTGSAGLRAVASPGGFSQVLATLLENSLAYGAGTVTVRRRTTGSSVVVEVGDEGEGIPPELGNRVFERSVSGRSSTGLGLALARDLAEADGGRLELIQHRPAVFAVFLTLAPRLGARPATGPQGN